MKKLALTVMTIALVQTSVMAAQGVGTVDYERIISGYPLAQKYKKELDAKAQDLKTYVETQEKIIQGSKTPEEANKVRVDTLVGIERKQKEYVTAKTTREDELTAKIRTASEAVRAEKDLELILKSDIAITGGADITSEVLKKLK